MNEQIRELAKQAGGHKCLCIDSITLSLLGENSIEKFAELIVQECLAHGKLTQSQVVVNGSEEYNAGREMGIEVFMNQIKQYFGVEQ